MFLVAAQALKETLIKQLVGAGALAGPQTERRPCRRGLLDARQPLRICHCDKRSEEAIQFFTLFALATYFKTEVLI